MGHDPQLREVESVRLDSWKEIASFLHRDARTVRRWERERQLPVHRVPGGERSGVFAYVAELERWLHAAETVPDAVTETLANPEAVNSCPDTSLSAFHSLNTFQTTFVADDTEIQQYTPATAEDFLPPHTLPPDTALLAAASRHPRHYQAAALIFFLTIAIGISAAVVHYRENRPLKTIAHRPNPEAQELYLRGRYDWNLRTEEGLNSAVDLFTQSIVNDPHYAAAYAGLADSYLLLRQYGHMPNSEAFPRALAAARQAIALDDSSPEAHRSLAFALRFWKWDMTAAETEYRRAIALNPNESQSHHWYATALLSSGRTHEALAQIDIARTLEPQSLSVLADRGLILSSIDPNAGILALQQVEQAAPAFVSTHRYLAAAYLGVEDYRSFLAESRSVAEISHDSATLPILERAEKVLAAQGPKPMLRTMALDLAPLADNGSVPAYNVAQLFGLAGETAKAIRYLHMACERRDPGFLTVKNDAAFTPLRSSPEYITLIARRDVAYGSNKQPIARLDAPVLPK